MKAGKISYAGVGVAVGGLIGFLGVIVGWFKLSLPVAGGTATVTLSGTHDWTGTVALAAAVGAFAFGIAYVVLQDPQLRRITGVLGAICSAFLLIMSLVGFSRVGDATAATGLAISFLGGVVAVVGSVLTSREMLSEGPAPAADVPAAPVEA
jgi:hypothetical protein